jgi:hypothetical protein
VTPGRPERTHSDRQPFSPQAVNRFAAADTDALTFPGAGRKRDIALSRGARHRRQEADETARDLLRGGLRDEEVYAAVDGDTMLDLATCGALRDYLGRQRRRWHGFADEAHALKAKWGREYAAFCGAEGITRAIQVVVRAPMSVVRLTELREVHARDSKRLGERLRYGRKRFAPGLTCDLVCSEVRVLAQHGAEVDMHFHLAARGSIEDFHEMRAYFHASGWTWWDSLTGGSEETERYPGALAQYESKSLAETIRQANEDGLAFSAENLAEFHRQTRHLAMTRAVGAFRRWKGELDRDGLAVIEEADGRVTIRPRRRLPAIARLRERLFTTTGARLLRLVLHDFGDGMMRPAMRVRGQEGISFGEIADTYQVAEAVAAAQRALLSSQATTAIPESVAAAPRDTRGDQPPWRPPEPVGGGERDPEIPW